MTRLALTRLALGLIVAVALSTGLWAQLAPKSFYTSFPGVAGWVWVAVDGPYNEHLLRDVGGLNLALATLCGLALLRPRLVHPAAAGLATLVFALPHFAYHLLHRNTVTDPLSQFATLAGLALVVVCAVWLALRRPQG